MTAIVCIKLRFCDTILDATSLTSKQSIDIQGVHKVTIGFVFWITWPKLNQLSWKFAYIIYRRWGFFRKRYGHSKVSVRLTRIACDARGLGSAREVGVLRFLIIFSLNQRRSVHYTDLGLSTHEGPFLKKNWRKKKCDRASFAQYSKCACRRLFPDLIWPKRDLIFEWPYLDNAWTKFNIFFSKKSSLSVDYVCKFSAQLVKFGPSYSKNKPDRYFMNTL